jgi:hypothetical protein
MGGSAVGKARIWCPLCKKWHSKASNRKCLNGVAKRLVERADARV